MPAEHSVPAQYSLPCSAVAICLAGAALAWPSGAAFPYAVIVVGAICCWAMQWQLESLPRTLVGALQAYTGTKSGHFLAGRLVSWPKAVHCEIWKYCQSTGKVQA